MNSDTRFPAAAYAKHVLSFVFQDAQRTFLDPLLEIHYAHAVMLARQFIIGRGVAAKCIAGLDALDRQALKTAVYDPAFEDLFFRVESELDRLCGADNAGRLHTARSRNDIDLTMYRMVTRSNLLLVSGAVISLRQTLLSLAGQHVETLMPAYTHTQPAQPITFSHYLLAAVELLERDQRRLEAAFRTVNRSPLGACAIAGTGFPIDRELTAGLLGFDGLQCNTYGAIAATDYLTEAAGALCTLMLNVGRVTQDFLLWSTAEFGYLRLSDAWVQISSIMPQKRNPVPLEHVRVLASKALAQAQGIFTALHNTPFGDINDAEDDLQPLMMGAIQDAERSLRVLSGAMAVCEVNVARMSQRAHADFLTVTELADTLVRNEGLSFHEAHGFVARAVKASGGNYSPETMVDALLALRTFETPRGDLLAALDPAHFVEIRSLPGGPAPAAVRASLLHARAALGHSEAWLAARTSDMTSYPLALRRACEELL